MRRHQWNLKFEQKINLNEYLDQYPAMYEAKQKLNSILLTKNIRAKGARELIPKLMDLIDQFANSPVTQVQHLLLGISPQIQQKLLKNQRVNKF